MVTFVDLDFLRFSKTQILKKWTIHWVKNIFDMKIWLTQDKKILPIIVEN